MDKAARGATVWRAGRTMQERRAQLAPRRGSSRVLYVTHVALIAFVLDEWFEGRSLPEFLSLYLAPALSLWPLAWATQRARRWLATGPKKQTRAA